MSRPSRSSMLVFALAAGGAAAAIGAVAWQAPLRIEDMLAARVSAALEASGQDWVRAEADGMRVTLRGTAPFAESRDAAMLAAMGAAGAGRITDLTVLPPPPPLPRPAREADAESPAPEAAPAPPDAPPPPSVLLSREGDRIAVAGRLPAGDAEALREALGRARSADPVAVLSDVSLPSAPPEDPEAWRATLLLALRGLEELESGAARISAETLELSGWIGAHSARLSLERRLKEAAPEGVTLRLKISAPPPVFRPFRFEASKDEDGIALRICHVQSAEEAEAIAAHLTALRGAPPAIGCRIGLGAPSGDWGEAAAAALSALARVEKGAVTLADRDVTFTAEAPTGSARFDRAAEWLSAQLGAGWALALSGPPLQAAGLEDPESLWFSARRRDGHAILTGRAPDEATRQALLAYARARFGPDAEGEPAASGLVVGDAAPPPSWRRAALAALDALGTLSNGAAAYDGRRATLSGAAPDPAAAQAAARALRALEAETGVKTLSVVTVDLPGLAGRIPLGPRRCLEELEAAQAGDPIGFEPGSSRIIAGSAAVLDRLAGALRRCGGLVVRIEGHTDSQGRETTNMALSRGRAEAVLDALRARGAPGWRMAARGYGETQPIADNDTEAGRAANRRIAFSYHGPEPDFAPERIGAPAPAAPGAIPGAISGAAEDAEADARPADDAAPAPDDEPEADPEAAGDGGPDPVDYSASDLDPAAGDDALPFAPGTEDGHDDHDHSHDDDPAQEPQ